MPRIRTIKPEFWQNEKLSLTLPETRLLAIGLLNFCDDDGYFKYHSRLIQSWIFPYSTTNNIHDFCIELEAIDYLVFFQDKEGVIYGKINKFEIHQKINRKVDSKIKGLELDHYSLSESSLSTHEQLTHNSLQERKGKERKGRERINIDRFKKSIHKSICIDDLDKKFIEFWSLYPSGRKIGKVAAKKKFFNLLKKDLSLFDNIVAGLKKYNEHWEQNQTKIEFIPYPCTFLNQERFNDEIQTTNWDFYDVKK